VTPFKHILVPTDFGEPADRALDLALDLAPKFGSKVTLLHATWLPPYYYAAYAEGLAWPTDELEGQANKELAAAVTKARARYTNVEGTLVSGEPWERILQAVTDRGTDLIVMGTHGRRGLSRVLLGSVAEKIVRLSPIPVLTISGKADQEAKEKALAQASGQKKD